MPMPSTVQYHVGTGTRADAALVAALSFETAAVFTDSADGDTTSDFGSFAADCVAPSFAPSAGGSLRPPESASASGAPIRPVDSSLTSAATRPPACTSPVVSTTASGLVAAFHVTPRMATIIRAGRVETNNCPAMLRLAKP